MRREVPFQKEFAELLEQRMKAAGVKAKSSKSEDIIIQYITLVKRIISPCPRKLLLAKDFECPSELKNGWDIFRTKVEAGDDINPYQSTTMKRKGYTDLMLSAWQIHHFHLGETLQPSGYIQRTGKILYAMVKEDVILALKIDEHNHWSDKELLDIAHVNWPELTSDWDVDANPEVDFSSEDIGKLRQAHVNVITRRADGTSTLGGYGITSAGTSVEATLAMTKINRMFEDVYKQAISEFEDTELVLGIDQYNNFCIAEKSSGRGIPVCNLPDISKYSYLF